MTPTDLITAMIQAAEGVTEGPWVHNREAKGTEGDSAIKNAEYPIFPGGSFMDFADGDFVCYARNTWPDIIATLQAQQRRIEELEKSNDRLKSEKHDLIEALDDEFEEVGDDRPRAERRGADRSSKKRGS